MMTMMMMMNDDIWALTTTRARVLYLWEPYAYPKYFYRTTLCGICYRNSVCLFVCRDP